MDRQKFPNEVCCAVLGEMDPWDAWALRRISRDMNRYVLRILVPQAFLPDTYIYIRRPQSYIFYQANCDIFTPSPSLTPEGMAAASSIPSHRGQRLHFTGLQGGLHASPIAEFKSAREEDTNEMVDKLEDEDGVQVIVRVGSRYYRHLKLPSLRYDPARKTMSLDWMELYTIILSMPERERRAKELALAPSALWFYRRDAPWVDEEDDIFSSTSSSLSQSSMAGDITIQPAEGDHMEDMMESGIEDAGLGLGITNVAYANVDKEAATDEVRLPSQSTVPSGSQGPTGSWSYISVLDRTGLDEGGNAKTTKEVGIQVNPVQLAAASFRPIPRTMTWP